MVRLGLGLLGSVSGAGKRPFEEDGGIHCGVQPVVKMRVKVIVPWVPHAVDVSLSISLHAESPPVAEDSSNGWCEHIVAAEPAITEKAASWNACAGACGIGFSSHGCHSN